MIDDVPNPVAEAADKAQHLAGRAASIETLPDHLSVSYASDDPIGHGDIDLAVTDLAQLREVRAALGDWELVLTEWVADYLGRNTLTVDGVGHVEVKRSTDRKKWDRRALVRAVLDSRRAPDPTTGELVGSDSGRAVIDDEFLSCSQDLGRVLDVWNLGTPRVTALRDRGIDPDEFCESSPGKTSVVIS